MSKEVKKKKIDPFRKIARRTNLKVEPTENPTAEVLLRQYWQAQCQEKEADKVKKGVRPEIEEMCIANGGKLETSDLVAELQAIEKESVSLAVLRKYLDPVVLKHLSPYISKTSFNRLSVKEK